MSGLPPTAATFVFGCWAFLYVGGDEEPRDSGCAAIIQRILRMFRLIAGSPNVPRANDI